MPDIFAGLDALGLELPAPPTPLATYVPAVAVHAGTLVFVSGQVPIIGGEPMAMGTVPATVSVDTARRCAAQCVLNGLAALRAEIGDLGRLRRVIRVGGFVAATPEFTDHPRVVDGASELLVELLRSDGRHARAAVGVASLPLGVPVEVEFTFLVD